MVNRRSTTAAIGTTALAVVLIAAAAAADEGPPVRTVESVDLDRYAGDWFEVARFPNRFQRQCAGDVKASYRRRPDGPIDVLNQCRNDEGTIEDAKGVARVVDEETSAKLTVRFAPAFLSFLPMVWGDYWILGLGDGYSWAVVGSPDREYLWVLARDPRMKEEEYAKAVDVARANGFDVERLQRTSQTAAAP